MRAVLHWVLLLILLAGCHRAPAPAPAPTVAELRFPVVVLYGKSKVSLSTDAAALGIVSAAELNAVTGSPPLIDSDFRVFSLQEFGSTHHWLWHMANPTSGTSVKFRLERTPRGGLETAREMLRARLDEQTWHSDLPKRRAELAKAQTLAAMAEILEQKDASPPERP